ncbi:hypothetical protein TCAL_10301 [Tigriopus californicus]|uniref:DH domain-containing protein n=1 Tax=Tigriopus californicus TaxID=6832 RepID=A0A553P0E5_TIGCA|nr:hypothetical protein TCAL_10301 [Tigriopus californicus]
MAVDGGEDEDSFGMSLRFSTRPRSLLLRRTSSCSALPVNQRKASRNSDWACNEGNPPNVLLNNKAPPIILQPLREGVEHISELVTPDPPCHFCREANSKPVHEDCTRLKIVSRGLVRSRDGSHLSPNTQPYISLPSPNIQSAKPTVPGGLSTHDADDDEDQGSHLHQSGPDCTHLVRRGALVPPKMDPDDDPGGSSMSNDDEGCGSSHLDQSTTSRNSGNNPGSTISSNLEHVGEVPGCGSNTLSVPGSESSCGHKSTSGRSIPPRRSSVVVIPPMQVCPGDLLVYSKALTHRGNYLELDGSTTSLSNEQDHSHAVTSSSRKSKNTWSLLKLFDRDKKPKSESPGGLEEVLANMSQSEFTDEQLPRLCGIQWFDFVELVDMERRGRVPWLSNHHHHHQRDLESPRNDLPESLKTEMAHDQQPCSDIDGLIGRDQDQQQLLDSSEDLVTDLVNVSQSGLDTNGSLRSKLAPAHRQRVSRLKRTQSERAPEGGAALHNLKKFGPNGSFSPLAKVVTPLSSRGSSPETKAPDQQSVTSLPIASNVTRQRRHNLVHSMSFTAKDIDPTRRILASRESLTREQKRIDSVWDLFQSEIAFLVDHLNVLKHVYMEPLKKVQVEGYIMFAEPEVLFGNLDELCCVTYSFCKEFLHLLLNMVEPDGDLPVSNLMIRLFEKGGRARTLSQAYHRYALNYINALNYLESLRRQPEFCEFEKWCNRDPRCKKLQLTDLLVAPVHHIMKIPLVIKDIEAKTDTREEKAIIARVLEMKEASLRELDDKMKWLKNFDRLLEIQRNIVWPSVLELDPKQYFPEFLKAALSRQPCERLIVSPRRQILMEGPLFLLDSGKPIDMYLILFDDLLIITRRKKSLSKKKSTLTENWGSVRSSMNDSSMKYIVHKQPLSLDRFFIHEVAPQEAIGAKLEHAFILICLNRFQQIVQVHTFQTETETLKNAWLSKLREAQEIWKRTLQTTIFKGSTSSCGDQDILGAQSTTSPEAAKGAPTLL